MDWVLGAQEIVVNTPPAQSGLTWASGLVFAAGVIAALGAVVAAIVTAMAAERRLDKTLEEERSRSEARISAENRRVEDQVEHERHIIQRSEASTALEHAARLITKNQSRLLSWSDQILEGEKATADELERTLDCFEELREEISVLALRFGTTSSVVNSLTAVLDVLNEVIPEGEELPLSDERKRAIRKSQSEVDGTVNHFLEEGRAAIENQRSGQS